MGIVKRLFLIVLSFGVEASTPNNVSSYYDSFLTGEYFLEDYKGPLFPDKKIEKLSREIVFEDAVFWEEINFPLLKEREVSTLLNTLKRISSAEKGCSNPELGASSSYIRYLFRLVSMSYLYEGLVLGEETLTLIGVEDIPPECNSSWENVFQACSPKSNEMKKFIQRLKNSKDRLLRRKLPSPYKKSEFENWLAHGNQFSKFLQKNFFLDKKISKEQTLNTATKFCSISQNIIHNVCSEADSIYGLKNIEKLREVLEESNAFVNINKYGNGKSCLNRFVKINSSREVSYYFLNDLFDIVYKNLHAKKARYVQGRIFLPGSLKEFDDKGLSNFIFSPPKKIIVAKRPVPVKVEPLPVVKKPSKKKKVEKKKPIKKKVVIKEIIKKEPPKKKVSYFEYSYSLFKEIRKDIHLDMNDFKEDFIFSEKMVKALKKSLKDFQTRKALEDMKKFDSLGMKKRPLSLLFLKFLIEYSEHQGLWNIKSIIGDSFYIKNDIERKTEPVWISLMNDESTNYTWRIVLTKKGKKI